MLYIKQNHLLNTTSGGLDIICSCYPQAKSVVSGNDKKFRIRSDDRTPSASLKRTDEGIWLVTDFGDDQIPRNGIQVYQKENNLTFREALVELASNYGIGGIKPEVNKPEFEKRPAGKEEKEGDYYFSFKKKIPDSDLKVLGPKVTEDVCSRYNCLSLESFIYIKNGQALITSSTPNYPIFLFDYGEFKKLYQPLNPDKSYRFRYVGKKEKDFVNGLKQLEQAYEDYINGQLKNAEEGEEKESELKKLESAVLCSGERDALNLAGYGYLPLWLNSETADLSDKNYHRIMKCADKLYLLLDIDSTGIRAANNLGKKYLEIYHVRLPDMLKKYKDPRGNSRKDFLDFIELYPKSQDVNKLFKVAKQMQFWRSASRNSSSKYSLNSSNLLFFLQAHGFYQMENKNAKSGQMFVKIQGHIVKEVKAREIKAFLIEFCGKNYIENDVLEAILNTTRLSDSSLQGLKQVDLNFTDYNRKSQLLFFRNAVWRITESDISEELSGKLPNYVWEEEVIDHNVKKLDHCFNIFKNDDINGYDIKILDTSSKFFSFLINASRIHWRKELEIELDKLSMKEKEVYLKKNQFSIDGDLLNKREIEEQKQHLINKIFAIGYLLHRYKSPSKAWAVFAMDNIIGEQGQSNGRSGKSFCFKALRFFMKTVTLSGRNLKLTENAHIYDRVTEHTDYVLIDDADLNFNFKYFFDGITGEVIVNPKRNQSYEIPFEKAPKFCFTSNHALRNLDTSLSARILYTVFSDFYHEQTEYNDYRETRKIYDDFGKNLFDSNYSEEEWNADFNFFAECIRFYLSVPSPNKINPPMDNVTRRNLLSEMGDTFKDWADVYFDSDGNKLNIPIVRKEAFNDFLDNTNTKGWKTNKFTKSLSAFCEIKGYTLNPSEHCNNKDRIIKKINNDKVVEMIFIQTAPSVEPKNVPNKSKTQEKPDLPF